MRIRTIWEIGLRIRDRRLELGWSQAELADRLGVTRQWVMSLEQGNAGAGLGQVLQALAVLGLVVDIRNRRTRKDAGSPPERRKRNVSYDDVRSFLDEVVERARETKGRLYDPPYDGTPAVEGEPPPRTPLRRREGD